MPPLLKQAVYAVNKYNINKEFVHSIDPDDPSDMIEYTGDGRQLFDFS